MAKLTQQQSEMNLKLMELLLDQNKKLSEQQNKINDLANSKNKGRGKNSKQDEGRENSSDQSKAFNPEQSSSLFQSLKNLMSSRENIDQDLSSSVSVASSFERIPDPNLDQLSPHPPLPSNLPNVVAIETPNVGASKSTIWLTKLSLELNGNAVDQLGSKCSKDQAMADFVRLYNTSGMANSLHSNNINYDAFLNGCFICAYDLSSSGICGSTYALPTVKTG